MPTTMSEPNSAGTAANKQLIAMLLRSRLFRDYENVFTRATGLPLALRPLEYWQLEHHDKTNENRFCALLAKRPATLAVCLQSHADIVQRTGLPIEAATFIGSSPIRRFTENWTEDFLLQTTEKAVKFAISLGLEVMYVTEDTTRCDPEMVKRLYSTAINCGARAVVVCDTSGHATPMGAYALTKFVIDEVVKPSGDDIRVDWHGHCDRGFAVANSMAALAAGADCVHACALGTGERVGNTQMDQMLVNLRLMGVSPWDQQDLTKLKDYCSAVSRATGVPVPANYPVFGEDAFRTATGVHAAAVIKAIKKNDIELANAVYSGVPSHLFGLEQVIDIGPMSGKSNVLFWLERRGIPASDDLVERIYNRAKSSDHTLSEAEIRECMEIDRSTESRNVPRT